MDRIVIGNCPATGQACPHPPGCWKRGCAQSQKRMDGFDANPHPSVQPWSRGPLFPAIIFRTERYSAFPSFDEVNAKVGGLAQRDEYERGKAAFYGAPLADRLESKWWSVILDGVVEEGLSTYDEAEQCARGMLAQRAARVVA